MQYSADDNLEKGRHRATCPGSSEPRIVKEGGFTVEWVTGSIRRECLDHVVIFGAQHLWCVLSAYADYYNFVRTHLGIAKDAPIHRPPEVSGRVVARSFLGGLHHQYVRI